ncbi:MAG: ADP-ribosylglycohydrolase family protein [Planctomycetes bacterium]|nr:ADP-ribosylglycohydrolase family protein [Planctomycetota bacterium]
MVRAALALDGLSVGDALGETCFRDENFEAILDDPRATARAPWSWTDDTAMALGIYDVLQDHGRIDQDALAKRFAKRFQAQPWRGYGAGAFRLLGQVAGGGDWRIASEMIFPGGSFGNGSAMRIAPLAGYFAEDDYAVIAEQAKLSAEITHTHPEGIAGGIAAAVAGAYAWKHRDKRADDATKRGMFDVVLAHTPPSEVRGGIVRSTSLAFDASAEPAVKLLDHGMQTRAFDTSMVPIVRLLGNGSRISCQDTVPFCVWAAARHLDDYQSAILNTIRVGGDIDTNCAIVGGIVALAVGRQGIPRDWLRDREELVV